MRKLRTITAFAFASASAALTVGLTGAAASTTDIKSVPPHNEVKTAFCIPRTISSTPSDADSRFLNMIHAAGIVAPDSQAIEVAHKVVALGDRSARYRVVRDFGVYDNHVDTFISAATATYTYCQGE
jgi:hypothetical protein